MLRGMLAWAQEQFVADDHVCWWAQSALEMLRRDAEVLRCYNDRWDAIW